MPKLRDPGPVKACRMVAGKVAGYRVEYDIKTHELAVAVGVSDETLNRKLRDPGTLTLAQLIAIARKCHFTVDDFTKIMNVALGL